MRRSLYGMGAFILGLHALGFLLLLSSRSGALLIGTGLTAYTLGLRHAFDADHIAAIDNATRKLMGEGKRPVSVGFWFSLGHCTVVFVVAFLLAIGVRSVGGALTRPGAHAMTATIGAGVSGAFLYLIAAVNLVILAGIVRLLRDARRGRCDEATLDERLGAGGLMYRCLRRFTRAISGPRQMYPVGLLFGLGFDTASEIALLILAAGAAGAGIPFYAILSLPVLFAAGMSLLDTIDGSFMNFAYGWAFSSPLRKLFYNLVITGLSVAVALVTGTIELGGLVAGRLGAQGGFWSWLQNVGVSALGMIIAGMFVVTWVLALLVWRVARLEERWGA